MLRSGDKLPGACRDIMSSSNAQTTAMGACGWLARLRNGTTRRGEDSGRLADLHGSLPAGTWSQKAIARWARAGATLQVGAGPGRTLAIGHSTRARDDAHRAILK